MGAKNFSGVRRVKMGRKVRLLIDFRFTNKSGVRERFKRVAAVQTWDAAVSEARRLMARAAETGSPIEDAVASDAPGSETSMQAFFSGTFKTIALTEFRPATRERYEALWRQGIGAHFGAMNLADITTNDIRDYAAKLLERGVQTKGPISFVKTLLRCARDEGLIEEVPSISAKFMKKSEKLLSTYAAEEVVLLQERTSGWLKIAIGLASCAGLRLGEVIALEVQDVDIGRGLLYVRRSVSHNVVMTPKGARRCSASSRRRRSGSGSPRARSTRCATTSAPRSCAAAPASRPCVPSRVTATS